MAMHTLQTILCRAAVDGSFLAALSAAPQRVLDQYMLSPGERAVLINAPGRSLGDFAAAVESWRRGEPSTRPVRELALAG